MKRARHSEACVVSQLASFMQSGMLHFMIQYTHVQTLKASLTDTVEELGMPSDFHDACLSSDLSSLLTTAVGSCMRKIGSQIYRWPTVLAHTLEHRGNVILLFVVICN